MHEYKRQQGLNLKRQIQRSFHPFMYCELSQWMRLKVTTSHAWENIKITLSVIGSASMKPFRHLFQNPSSIYSPPVHAPTVQINTKQNISSYCCIEMQRAPKRLKTLDLPSCTLNCLTIEKINPTHVWYLYLDSLFFHISHKPASLVLNQNTVTPLNDTYWQNGIVLHVALFSYHLGDEEFIWRFDPLVLKAQLSLAPSFTKDLKAPW